MGSQFFSCCKEVFMLKSLDDLLRSTPLTIDVVIEHEWTGAFPVKGVEMEATVLYVELPEYFRLTLELGPAPMLIHGNMFVAWLERLVERAGISAVYSISGLSVSLIFSSLCGSGTPCIDALRVARLMGENDVFGFHPSIGIGSGVIMAGSASFKACSHSSLSGRPLLVANACARVRPAGHYASCISLPVAEWSESFFDDVFSPRRFQDADQDEVHEEPLLWEPGRVRTIDIPGIGGLEILDIASFIHWNSRDRAEQKSRDWFVELQRKGYYRKS